MKSRMPDATRFPSDIVTDTSVLINFLVIDRMDLFAKYSRRFIAPIEVREEVTGDYPVQVARLKSAIRNDAIVIHPEIQREELLAGETAIVWGYLGEGETAAIALAAERACSLAIDDAKAIEYLEAVGYKLHVLKTQDLMVAMIKENLLDVSEADQIKDLWTRKYRFRIKHDSFQQLIDDDGAVK